MNMIKTAVILPAVAILSIVTPTEATARTKSIVKYGAIGLGAAAIYNMGRNSSYHGGYYGGGHYGGGYGGYHGGGYGYYSQPRYVSYPSYYGHHHGCHY